MRRLAALLAICALASTARSETTYPIPLPKPSHFIPLTRPDGTPGYAGPDGEEDAAVNSRMKGICRGC